MLNIFQTTLAVSVALALALLAPITSLPCR